MVVCITLIGCTPSYDAKQAGDTVKEIDRSDLFTTYKEELSGLDDSYESLLMSAAIGRKADRLARDMYEQGEALNRSLQRDFYGQYELVRNRLLTVHRRQIFDELRLKPWPEAQELFDAAFAPKDPVATYTSARIIVRDKYRKFHGIPDEGERPFIRGGLLKQMPEINAAIEEQRELARKERANLIRQGICPGCGGNGRATVAEYDVCFGCSGAGCSVCAHSGRTKKNVSGRCPECSGTGRYW